MRSYPKNNLYSIYKSKSGNHFFSPRLPDHTNQRTLELMNSALNCCDQWNTFLDVGAGDGRYSVPLLYKFKNGYAIEVEGNDSLQKICKTYKQLAYSNKLIQDAKISGKIDFILLADVFEHIPIKDVKQFISKLDKL